MLCFKRKEDIDVKTIRAINQDIANIERRISSFDIRLETIEKQHQKLSGKVYQHIASEERAAEEDQEEEEENNSFRSKGLKPFNGIAFK